jgi:hypothetical protein
VSFLLAAVLASLAAILALRLPLEQKNNTPSPLIRPEKG